MIDAESHEIQAVAVTTSGVNDAKEVDHLLKPIEREIARAAADGVYDKPKKVDRVLGPRTKCILIPPRSNGRIGKHGNAARPPLPRDENVRTIRRLGRRAWKRESGDHVWSLAKTGVFRMKMIFGGHRASRSPGCQVTEGVTRVRALNIMTHIGMQQCERGRRPIRLGRPPATTLYVQQRPGSPKSAGRRGSPRLDYESGFILNPLVRHTWAPKGQTPVLVGFDRHYDKVSTIAALSLAPRRRIGLYWRTDPKSYIDAPVVVAFLRDLLRHLRGKVIVVWDGGSNHKGPLIRDLRAVPVVAPGATAELRPEPQPGGDDLVVPGAQPAGPRRAPAYATPGSGHSGCLAEIAKQPALIKSLWGGSKLTFPDKKLAT
ncbi:MAG: transposase [Isosphaeraceae bacterium]|nr:transposase [Isosphaeraceae bacterium]